MILRSFQAKAAMIVSSVLYHWANPLTHTHSDWLVNNNTDYVLIILFYEQAEDKIAVNLIHIFNSADKRWASNEITW